MSNQKPTSSTVQRPGWDEAGHVDLAAVRAGTPDLADAPAILESLVDEVEELRGEVERLRNLQRVLIEQGEALCDEITDVKVSRDGLRELMVAVLAAITPPYPATVGDEDAYRVLLERRAMLAAEALRMAMEDDYNVPIMARHLRSQTAGTQVTYKTSGGDPR